MEERKAKAESGRVARGAFVLIVNHKWRVHCSRCGKYVTSFDTIKELDSDQATERMVKELDYVIEIRSKVLGESESDLLTLCENCQPIFKRWLANGTWFLNKERG